MALFKRNKADQFINDAVDQAVGASTSNAGIFATIISAFALLFSGYSFYETVLRASDFAVYVPPRIDYTDPNSPDHPFEVFIIPVTLVNDGARSGTVLSIDLEITNPRTRQTKLFFASHQGAWGYKPKKPFMPVALTGKNSSSQLLQFIPRAGEKINRILDSEAGSYDFKLSLNTASNDGGLPGFNSKVRPLVFSMQIKKLNYFNFNKTGTMPMWSKDYRPAKTGAK